MTRWTLAGCMALAALGAVTVLDVGAATAEAAPIRSAYAGKYVGLVPGSDWMVEWNISIAGSGAMTGSYVVRWRYTNSDYKPFNWIHEVHAGDFAGNVDANGHVEISAVETFKVNEYPAETHTFTASALVVKDVNGDLVYTDAATGTSVVWVRQ